MLLRKPADGPGGLALTTGFVFVAMGAGNFMGYLYQLFVARTLGAETFGVFGALLGIFYVATLCGNGFRIGIAAGVARRVAELGEIQAVAPYLRKVIWLAPIFLGIPLSFLVTAKWISAWLHLASSGPILILGFAIFSTLLLAVGLGLLQGLQRFGRLVTIGYLLPQGLKLLFGAVFIIAGWQLLGAVGALLVSEFIPLSLVAWQFRKQLSMVSRTESLPDSLPSDGVFPGLLLAFFIAAPTNLDVVLVVHFFDAAQSGIYAAVATIGRVVIFLPMAVSLVVLPKVAERHASGLPTTDLVLKGLFFTIVVCAPAVLFCWLVPNTVIKLLFGEPYREAAPLVGWYSFAMLIFVVNLLLVQHLLAVGRRRHIYFIDSITFGTLLTIYFWHPAVQQVVTVLLAGNLITLCYVGICLGLWLKSGLPAELSPSGVAAAPSGRPLFLDTDADNS